jgi:hypothetical protein
MQRVACHANDVENAVGAPTCALFGQIQRRALPVGVYERDRR